MARHLTGRVGHLFLSYASVDQERVLTVATELDQAGIPTWIDRRGITGGSSWASEISAAIRECAALAILCSDASVHSRNVRQEVQLAWDWGRPIVPILLETVEFPDDLAYFVQGLQWIDARDRVDIGWVASVSDALASLARSDDDRALPTQVDVVADIPSVWRTHRIPTGPSPLIGRERELAAITTFLRTDQPRLVTLIGPGGVGKTRLSIAVATELAGDFQDGATFVDLAPLSDAALVPGAIVAALGLRDTSERAPIEVLTEFLRDRRFLLVLDNFEHVLAASTVPAMLLRNCPGLVVICTSREPLRIAGEHERLVDPLILPDPGSAGTVEQVGESGAVALFVSRAQHVRPSFELTKDNASDVADICRRLDGLPLAIELAAARIRLLPPAILLDRLTNRLAILTGGNRDAPDRQHTLRQTIAWSYDLLNPTERTFFRNAAIFTGGFTLEAAEEVAAGPGDDALEMVTSLAEKQLLRYQGEPGADLRFMMLETIREFGKEQSPTDTTQRAHAAYYLALAEQAAPGLLGADLVARLEQLDRERDNLRAAFDWLILQNQMESAARLATALHFFWRIRGPVSQGRSWVERLLGAIDTLPIRLQSNLLIMAGDLVNSQGDSKRALPLLDQGLILARECGDPFLLAWALGFRGLAAIGRGEYNDATEYFQEAFGVEGYAAQKALSSTHLDNLGTIARHEGDLVRATELHEQALALSRESEFAWAVATISAHLAHDVAEMGDYDRAASLYRASMRQLWARREQREFAGVIAGFAELLALTGQAERAARLCGATDALLDSMGVSHVPAGQLSYERAVSLTQGRLGMTVFADACAIGRVAGLDQILAEVDCGLE